MRVLFGIFGSVWLAVAVMAGATGIESPGVAAASVGVEGIDDDGDPINGRRLFLKMNCYGCHGGRGGGGMCPSLRDGDADEDVIREGTDSGMPAFGRLLTEQEISDLVAYIESMRTPEEPTFTHWWEPVPTR
jgi:mono/diheme cytochrome c family protein